MNKRGFTLVELMVVIVIIGILAAVAVPRMMSAANRARAGEGPSILSAVATAQHVRQASEGGFFLDLPTLTTPTLWMETLGISQPTPQYYTDPTAVAGGANDGGFLMTMTVTTPTRLGSGTEDGAITVNAHDQRRATGPAAFTSLVSNWPNN